MHAVFFWLAELQAQVMLLRLHRMIWSCCLHDLCSVHRLSTGSHSCSYLQMHCSQDFPRQSLTHVPLQVRTSETTSLLTCLLEGPSGAGKTALAATLGLESGFPFVKVITSDNMVGYSEAAKCQQIAKVFDDAYRVSVWYMSDSGPLKLF